MRRFEYKFCERTFAVPDDMPAEEQIRHQETWLNELGAEGWEIVTDRTPPGNGGHTLLVRILMKRQIDG